MSKETVYIIEDLISQLNTDITYSDVVDNLDGTYTYKTTDTSILFPDYVFSVGGINYTVINDLQHLFLVNEEFTIKGSAYLNKTKIELPKLFYFHGTLLDTKTELDKIQFGDDKFPLVYLFEVINDDFNDDETLRLDRTTSVRMFFLSNADENNWTTDDHYNFAIIPMKNVLNRFVALLKKSSIIGKFKSHKGINYAKFGTYSKNGMNKRIFSDKLSGVEFNITLPILKQNNCLKSTVHTPPNYGCLSVTVTDSNTTTIVEVPSGGAFACTPTQQIPDSLYNPTKTGKPSIIAGDDGQTQAGRLVDFYTLDFISPFGSNVRFTNDKGGLYSDNTDGSTPDYVVDNATRLGYKITYFYGAIAQAITNASSLSIGLYTDFRVCNINEFTTILNPNGGWKPEINFFGDFELWGVNTFWSSSLIYASLSNGLPYVAGITKIRRFLNVRNHTY